MPVDWNARINQIYGVQGQGGRQGGGIRWDHALDNGLTLAMIAALAVVCAVTDARHLEIPTGVSGYWGSDFHGGLWPAATAILHGASPYPADRLHVLLKLPQPFYWPPLMAVLSMPLAHLPFLQAIGIFNLVCIASFIGGLCLFGLRDWRLYALALLSFPFQQSLYWGQAEGIHILLLALAWRNRDSWRGGVAAGVVIAAKLLAWPLLVWMVASRRFACARATVITAVLLLVASWGLIDFHGMLSYPHLLGLDARIYERSPLSFSAISLFLHDGVPAQAATMASVALTLLVGAAAVTRSRGSEEGWFAAAIFASLLWSPLLWTHYLVVILAPLCVTHRRSIRVWLLTAGFWVFAVTQSYDVRATVTLAIAVALTLVAARPPEASPVAETSEQRQAVLRVVRLAAGQMA